MFDCKSPVIDGRYLPTQPLDRINATGCKVPLLAGFNADEAKLLGLFNPNILRKANEPWATTWSNFASADGEEASMRLRAAYSDTTFSSPREFILTAATDLLFAYAARDAVRT